MAALSEISPSFDVVAAGDLHVLDVLFGVLLGVPAAVADGVDHRLPHLGWHVAAWAAQVQVPRLLVDEVVHQLLALLEAVRDVDLLLLLAAQGEDDVLQDVLLLVLVELGLVAVLDAVPGAEEEGHGRALLALLLGLRPLLDEGAHGRDARAQGDHHHRGLVAVRHGHRGGVHVAPHRDALGGDLQLVEPAGAEADTEAAAGGVPVVPDDAQVAVVVPAHAG
mmetsp:Transcript_115347/g.326834  ORF Transcript_115347/g.326834 Transcript_115347/m.326834 type:complete len:222 (+) Transcript_115347:67-732(+)